jgi:hypothetical protein
VKKNAKGASLSVDFLGSAWREARFSFLSIAGVSLALGPLLPKGTKHTVRPRDRRAFPLSPKPYFPKPGPFNP